MLGPRLRENVLQIRDSGSEAVLITTAGEFDVPLGDARRFLRIRGHCTGHHAAGAIALRAGIPLAEVEATLDWLRDYDLLAPDDAPSRFDVEEVRALLLSVSRIWSEELQRTFIGNEFALGQLPKEVLIGWLIEMYHYIRDFPYAIEHAADHATGGLRDVLLDYAGQERGHEEFVLRTLENLGMRREEVESSAPFVSTRSVAMLMRDIYARCPAAVLIVAAMVEAQDFDEEQISAFRRKLAEHYDVDPAAFEPYFRHQEIDVGFGHAELLARNLPLIDITDAAVLDRLVNDLHDLKHAFDLQGLELKEYFGVAEGRYLPRQRVSFASL